jgi:hypothetical protein
MKICIVESCTSVVKAKGYCCKHHQKWFRYGDPLYSKKSSEPAKIQIVTQRAQPVAKTPKPKLDLSKWY